MARESPLYDPRLAADRWRSRLVARQSPQGAARIEARLHELTGLIETYPAAGQSTSRTGIRRLVLTPYPYLVFYRIIDGEVLVMRFRHGARRPVQM